MKLIIDVPQDDIDAIKYLKVKGWASRHELLILNGIPLDDYCLTQCETGNPCLYCKHEFENKYKHIAERSEDD